MALPAANVGIGKPSKKLRPAFFNNKESSIVTVSDNDDRPALGEVFLVVVDDDITE